jgi:dethiobiotin synthetase
MTETAPRKGFFIAGTDTGVGKTVVAAGLIRLAAKRGLNAVGVKPVETGCPVKSGELFPADGAMLCEASGQVLSLDACAPFRFSLPASPFRAAAMEDRQLRISDLTEHVRALAEDAEVTIVEGAGGLMAPIEERLFTIHFIEQLALPVILVGRTGLGTINHTLLSAEALGSRSLRLSGIVMSAVSDSPGPEESYTPGDIAPIVKPVPVLKLPHMDAETVRNPDAIADTMMQHWPEHFLNELFE